jgi:predicted metal-dependent phosphoesterase TrpH
MKGLFCLLITISFLVLFPGLKAQPSIGGYYVYYGSLHNHSNASDGTGTPDSAYNYAKNVSQLDFFSLSDHSGSIDTNEWKAIKEAADFYNEDGVFTTFRGFEWSSSNTYGHVTVINTEDYCTTSAPANTFGALCAWLDSRDGLAFLNHPGREDDTDAEFSHFKTTPSGKIAGMELWNKRGAFSQYYYNDGYYPDDREKSYFDEALVRKWRIGAMGGEDNHSGTWGNYCVYRMAVLANSNSRTEIFSAMQARRFFTTLDKNIALSFKINGKEMGSTIKPGNYTMEVQATDADREVFKSIRLVKNGVVINTWKISSSSLHKTLNLVCASGDYFYVVIKEADDDEAISSPIWCYSPGL